MIINRNIFTKIMYKIYENIWKNKLNNVNKEYKKNIKSNESTYGNFISVTRSTWCHGSPIRLAYNYRRNRRIQITPYKDNKCFLCRNKINIKSIKLPKYY